MQALRKVLESRPSDAMVLNQLAMAARLRYYQSGDMDFRDQELEALRKAVKLAPKLETIQVNYGTTAWELGMRKEAARAYERALEDYDRAIELTLRLPTHTTTGGIPTPRHMTMKALWRIMTRPLS